MTDIDALVSDFRRHFCGTPRIFYAPGRVNLIGEHTDYNDGFVLPMAIDRGTAVAIAPRADRILRVRSLNLDEAIELDLGRVGGGRRGNWQDYIEGIVAALAERGAALGGAEAVLRSDVSIGGGLSSSAALEMAVGSALLAVSGASMDRRDLALAGQAAEHRHVGIQCGIMDQFCSVFAVKGHALRIDCRSLDAVPIPLELRGTRIVVCDSRVHHSLASSEYNRRRRDCEAGVRRLASALPAVRSLRDTTLPELEAHRGLFPETVFRRCRHVVGENARTLRAAEALSGGGVEEVGRLMLASHASLRDDYEVSCAELDLLVDCAMRQRGVLGARMTGGGFGGCTVNLVDSGAVGAFGENISREYESRTGIRPEIFSVEASDGAREIPASIPASA